jgi:hypothetical protein
MSHSTSKFWTFFALPGSLLVLGAAYYVRVPSVRHAIDARTPIVHQLLGKFISDSTVTVVEVKPAQTPKRPIVGTPKPEVVAATPTPSPSVAVTSTPAPAVFDIQALERDRTHWPKTVRLTKAANFPAVSNGKVVGSVVAPSGAEANLVAIKDGKLGLEFQGGGSWLAVEDTDFKARMTMP